MVTDVKQIRRLLKEYFRVKGRVNVDAHTGMVNVHGDVTASQQMKEFPVKFGHVTGNFDCSWNNLITLEGAPHTVEGTFKCNNNDLTNLLYAPTQVGGAFNCSNNQITSLEHAPTQVGGVYVCSGNKLTSLAHAPEIMHDSFYCRWNFLTNLQHAPVQVDGDFLFDFNYNTLKSLEGLPKTVSGQVVLSYKKDLPMLRLLMCECDHLTCESGPQELNGLLNTYKGQGKAGALKAAAELIRAGYKENAKW